MKTTYRLLSILLAFIVLTGCWDNKDIEELSFILGAAFDKSEDEENPIEYTGQLATLQNENVGPSNLPPFHNFTLTGDSIHEIIRELAMEEPNPLYTNHLKVIILQENLLEDYPMSSILNQVTRDNVSRMSPRMFLTRESGKEVLSVEGNADIPSTYLRELTNNHTRTTGLLPSVRLGDAVTYLSTKSSFLMPNVELVNNDIKLNGAGIIKGRTQKYAGHLDQSDVEGVNWIKGQATGGVVKMKNDDGVVTVYELQTLDTKVIPKWSGGTLSFQVNVTSSGWITEDWSQEGDSFESAQLEKVEKETSKEVTRMMEDVMKKIQEEYAADVVGFHERFRIAYPKEWERVKGEWDELFAEADVTFDVDITVTGFGSEGTK
ncbi:Ger(x)C family spore germination protein [Halobacillus sp. KGW1]|uniref:Ger(x)C family spore germination protein n=1 Tax=Halobacillus sp. KGW1 TaxID=1793726 RepID=UPI00078291C4|nr:Ger(x)C family spore germination protein [Halobacillus sp. KGW1]